MAEYPNDASRKSKAEGDRWSSETDQSTQSASGLSAGRTRLDEASDVVNRGEFDTPRRYDQPIEDDDDPVMPSDDTTLNTKI